MRPRKIELDAPNLGRRERDYVNNAIRSNFISTYGPFVLEFEKKFSGFVNTSKAVSTQSGTAALHIALYEMGIKGGDEVIAPALTFVATINPIIYVGATPVFVDVDMETWNISPVEIEKNITARTKAIIPVHLYGNPCNMDEICSIAGRHGLFVIEDATEALGAIYRGRHVGTFGDLGVFSFNGNKTITTGGGGMVVGNDEARIDHIKFLVNQARDESRGYYHPEIGFNYRMTNIEAALGLAQMERISKFLHKRKRFHYIYYEELGNVGGITFQEELDGAKNSFWLNAVLFERGMEMEALREKLREKRIPTRRIFTPAVEFPPFYPYKNGDYRNSYDIFMRGLCLPSSTLNKEADIVYTAKTIKKILK